MIIHRFWVNKHQPMHHPCTDTMHGAAFPSSQTPIRPHLTCTHQHYMILLLHLNPYFLLHVVPMIWNNHEGPPLRCYIRTNKKSWHELKGWAAPDLVQRSFVINLPCLCVCLVGQQLPFLESLAPGVRLAFTIFPLLVIVRTQRALDVSTFLNIVLHLALHL